MLDKIKANFPIVEDIAKGEEVLYLNANVSSQPLYNFTHEIREAEERLNRFAPFIRTAFPETQASNGIIESPLVEISSIQKELASMNLPHIIHTQKLPRTTNNIESTTACESSEIASGRLLLKCDNLLPISGSIKARGGIYEVLCVAEKIALESGMLQKTDNYSILAEERFRKLFSQYSLAVGSTGNLGLSIGIMSAKLGFQVSVHMSSDAREWKKRLLRQKGVEVVEYAGDYCKAVSEGRKLAESNPKCHFVDDENSKTLFLGYATAAERVRKQLEDMNIIVDEAHPLFVYLPCGVGGGPGGVAYGLKCIYGKNVHILFAEPTMSPCMLLGITTGMHDKISVFDVGLSGKTLADGLAVGKASKLVCTVVKDILDGIYTVKDERMEELTRTLFKAESIFIEHSATVSLLGYPLTLSKLKQHSFSKIANATHICWATGGGMVPESERKQCLENI